ncbi:peptidylprolyl isomerase [Acidovorax sp. M14]|uniref:peptidylprolyl isomerase n=1 Tax=Acidovorax sp. M14 TaxID=3411354 RepID=UPI003BF4CB0C
MNSFFQNARCRVLRAGFVLVVSGLSLAAQAAGPLAHGKVPGVGDIQVSADDVAADIQRIPVEVRPQVLTQTKTMNQLVTNLYTRRVLAERAHVEGLDKRPDVAAALALARDKVLSDALLAYVVDKGNTPPDDKALAMAQTMYKADAKSFQMPEQVRIRHILIAPGKDKDDAAAEKEARDLLAQLRSGGDFAALAKAHSADPGSASKGGDLGFFAQGRMVPEFDTAAFQLQKVGDFSDLVKTQFGYHILQLQERKPAGQQSFDEVKEALVAKVKQSEVQKGRNELAEQLEATMKLDEPAVKATIEKLTQQSAAAKKP